MRNPLPGRGVVALVLCLGLTDPAGRCATANAAAGTSSRLVILSTTDVMGKTSPCGCTIPKGGLARRASFRDSLRAGYPQVLLVDAGGYFPDLNDTLQRGVATFMMDAMRRLETDAVGTGEKELRFGYSFLKANVERSGLPVVCSNLALRATGKPALTPYIIKRVGTTNVGIFSLMSEQAALGPSQDSLAVGEPTAAARRVVAEMRKKGATVIVMLSQMGKVESEDLAATVPGIDVVIVGHTSSLLMKGRRIKQTVMCYGGEQGQYVGRTLLTLDASRRMTNGECDLYAMGPGIPNDPGMFELVKAFEDGFAGKQKAAGKQRETGVAGGH